MMLGGLRDWFYPLRTALDNLEATDTRRRRNCEITWGQILLQIPAQTSAKIRDVMTIV